MAASVSTRRRQEADSRRDGPAGQSQLGVDGVFTDFPDTGVEALSAVPEPQTQALMLLGLAGVLGLVRRRRNAA